MNDVVEMVKVKLADDLIIAQIHQNRTPFELSATEMVQLKTAGASDNVIRAMMEPQGARRTGETLNDAASSALVPSEASGQRGLAAQVSAESEGRAQLVSFRKTDGQSAQVNGVPVYSLEFEGSVEFTQDCKWLRDMFDNSKLEFKTRALTPRGPNELNNFFEASQFPGVVVNKGAVAGIAGVLTYEKYETGWRPTRLSGRITSQPTHDSGAAAAAPAYDVTFTLDQGAYSGTTTFDVDRKGVVTGTMKLTSPIAVDATLGGAVKDGTWTFDYPYTIAEQGCSGTVTGTGTVSADRTSITGDATIAGSCVEQPTAAAFSFTRK